MPHKHSSSKELYFWIMSTLIVVIALIILVSVFHVNEYENRDHKAYSENSITVDPRTQAALESMARAFNKWER